MISTTRAKPAANAASLQELVADFHKRLGPVQQGDRGAAVHLAEDRGEPR